MANTYIKIFIHTVFAVKNRNSLISPFWRNKLYAYLATILQASNNIPIKIGGTDDHIHILFSYSAKMPLPDLIRDLKSSSTKFINEQRLSVFKYEWQKGYACFSYSASQIDDVSRYIDNQYEHHKGYSLTDEIKNMLSKFGIEYDEKYIFSDPQ